MIFGRIATILAGILAIALVGVPASATTPQGNRNCIAGVCVTFPQVDGDIGLSSYGRWTGLSMVVGNGGYAFLSYGSTSPTAVRKESKTFCGTGTFRYKKIKFLESKAVEATCKVATHGFAAITKTIIFSVWDNTFVVEFTGWNGDGQTVTEKDVNAAAKKFFQTTKIFGYYNGNGRKASQPNTVAGRIVLK
jgi:hypothetical protein